MRKVGLVILTLCTAFLSLNIAEAVEDSPSSRATLKGLPGLSVDVPRLSGCENFGVHSQAIGAEVDSQLQEAGIKVLPAGPVVLLIIFACMPLGTDAGLVFSTVRIDQTISWPNSVNDAIVTSWRSGRGIRISHRAKVPEDLRKEIKKRVGQFIEAWLSVNGEVRGGGFGHPIGEEKGTGGSEGEDPSGCRREWTYLFLINKKASTPLRIIA